MSDFNFATWRAHTIHTQALSRYNSVDGIIEHCDWVQIYADTTPYRLGADKRVEIIKTGDVGPVHYWFRYRSANQPMGRLGGGWQWGLGIEGSERSISLTLFVCQVVLSWGDKK